MALRSTGVRNLIVLSLLSAVSLGISSLVSAGAGSDNANTGAKMVPKNATGKGSDGNRAGAKQAAAADTVLARVRNYRQWRAVNSRAHWVAGPMAAMCAAPLPSNEPGKDQPANPHQDKWVRVYVNPAGASAMMTQKVPAFPAGSVIVKEKLATDKSDKPELLTVMAKREAGYDSANGDWEYLALDGDAGKVRARGKLANCQACHIPQKANGYVFRDYLPEGARKNLK